MAYQIKRYCDKCGKEISLEAIFCPYCGTKIEDEAPETDKQPTVADEKQSDIEKTEITIQEPILKPQAERKTETEPLKQTQSIQKETIAPPVTIQEHNEQAQQSYTSNYYNSQEFNAQPTQFSKEMLNKLCDRVKWNGIIWAVIGILQITLALSVSLFVFDWILIVVGVSNLVLGIYNFNLSKKWRTEPKDIIKAIKPMALPIIVLIYNILIGAIFGIIGSIYYFVAIRDLVMKNEKYFAEFDSKE